MSDVFSVLTDHPYEVLVKFFENLRVNDALHLGSTCRKFRKIMERLPIWKDLLSRVYSVQYVMMYRALPGSVDFFKIYILEKSLEEVTEAIDFYNDVTKVKNFINKCNFKRFFK